MSTQTDSRTFEVPPKTKSVNQLAKLKQKRARKCHQKEHPKLKKHVAEVKKKFKKKKCFKSSHFGIKTKPQFSRQHSHFADNNHGNNIELKHVDTKLNVLDKSNDETRQFLDTFSTPRTPVEKAFIGALSDSNLRRLAPESPADDNIILYNLLCKRLKTLDAKKRRSMIVESSEDTLKLFGALPRVDFSPAVFSAPPINAMARGGALRSLSVEPVRSTSSSSDPPADTATAKATFLGVIVSLDKRLLTERLATVSGHVSGAKPVLPPKALMNVENAALQMKLMQMHKVASGGISTQ